eukprot:CAMPEP_0185022208 /NCGR_PEP_ID=MMETSP1103-20130426/4938_1 /TAXON_ID=36769 /ORGANISM="Paraphysomonas bandaiensis, Strain Caron Lab Isolate" /LENGTH=313 /DNA_ID=CAMNT_0027554179 /DNA_START=35 /DNA_END=973 /DNA_ORIENTATION=+
MLLIVLTIIVVVYKALEKFPLVFNKRRRFLGKKGFAQVIAHRGSREEGLTENTIAAFDDAAKVGADIIELDVWLTKDEEVVVFHDDTLTRMTNGASDKCISELNYSDLPDLVPSSEQSYRVTEYDEHKWKKIPLLRGVLAALPPDVSLIIEFKMKSDTLIKKVMQMLVESNHEKKVFWFSLIESINVKLREFNPNIPTITSVLGILKVLVLYYTGVLPFVSLDDDVFGITMEAITLKVIREERALASVPDWIKVILSYVFAGVPPKIMLAPGLFTHLRKRGVPVWFLGVNHEEHVEMARTYGATAVLTDRVDW